MFRMSTGSRVHFGSENCLRSGCGHSGEVHDEEGCNYDRQGAWVSCNCIGFISPSLEAVKGMSDDQKRLLACALYFGIQPKSISDTELSFDGGGHITGINVILHIDTGRLVQDWVKEHLPKGTTHTIIEDVSQILG